ncbi:MAG: DUF167 domain-containing protein [Polyangiaceae bacterium]
MPKALASANVELVRTLSEFFGVARSQVRIASGKTGKNKVVLLVGARLEDVAARLARTTG